jgi:hypothetical protein
MEKTYVELESEISFLYRAIAEDYSYEIIDEASEVISNIKKKLSNLIDRIVLWIKKTLNNLKSTFSKTVIMASYDSVYNKYMDKEGSVSDEDFKAWKEKWTNKTKNDDERFGASEGKMIFCDKLSPSYYELMKGIDILVTSQDKMESFYKSNDLWFIAGEKYENEMAYKIQKLYLEGVATIDINELSAPDTWIKQGKKKIVPGIINVTDSLYEALNNAQKSLVKIKNIKVEKSTGDEDFRVLSAEDIQSISKVLNQIVLVNKVTISTVISTYRFVLASSKDLVKLKK